MRDALEGGTGDGSPLSRQGPRRRLPEQEEKGEDRSGAIIIKSQFVPGLSRVFPQGPLLAQSNPTVVSATLLLSILLCILSVNGLDPCKWIERGKVGGRYPNARIRFRGPRPFPFSSSFLFERIAVSLDGFGKGEEGLISLPWNFNSKPMSIYRLWERELVLFSITFGLQCLYNR